MELFISKDIQGLLGKTASMFREAKHVTIEYLKHLVSGVIKVSTAFSMGTLATLGWEMSRTCVSHQDQKFWLFQRRDLKITDKPLEKMESSGSILLESCPGNFVLIMTEVF